MTVSIQRVRLRFKRTAAAALASHLQQIEAVRRALEKSSWPLAKSEGKRPKIKASFGPAISVGYESEAEYCDVELVSRLDMKTAVDTLQPHMPDGFSAMAVKSIPRFFPSLDQTLNAAAYELRSPLLAGTKDKWEAFGAQKNFMVTKKKADENVVVDARACVRSWALEGDRLSLVIRFGPGRTLKPERIVQAVCGFEDAQVEMGTSNSLFSVKRLQFYLEKENGELVEP